MAADADAKQATCSFNISVLGVTLAVTKYVAFGDSLTEGENALPQRPLFVDTPNSYPVKLQALLDSSYPGQNVNVVSSGSGGEKLTTTGLFRLMNVLAANKPGALLLLDGENDLDPACSFFLGLTPECSDAVDLAGFGIRDAIRISKQPPNNIPFNFVGTLPPPGVVAPGAPDRRRSPDAIVKMNGRIRMFAALEGARLVDIYPLFLGHEAEYISIDGLHLTPIGNQVVAEAFFAAIKDAIPQTPAAGLR
jgi:lysophospholipase L1-like esterase